MPRTTTQNPVPEAVATRVREGLDSIRLRLLDLTNRNKLISFRHTTSTVRLVDVDLDAVYAALVDGQKLPFVYVPEPTRNDILASGEKPGPRDYAAGLGWNTGFDLKAEEGRTNGLPILHYKEAFDTLIRKVQNTAKTVIDESGVNLLHLVFGFLEWRESDDSTQVRHAPLLVVPVKLELPKSTEEDRSVRVAYDDEDLNTNLSLIEKMRRDFSIEIPALQEGEGPTAYFARVQKAIGHKRDWRICRQVSMGLLSFAKLLMYLDLDVERWPDASLQKHPRLIDVFGSEMVSGLSFSSEYDLDQEAKREPLPALVCDADSSQHSALIDVGHGKNLVIEGPPGTGKSQTITNLIAAALSQGKRVLFVAEKMAALDVVKRRLDKARLGEFCLELHSHKTNKVALLKSLDDRIAVHQTMSDPTLLNSRAGLLETHKNELTRYVRLMNQPYGEIQRSPFELIWSRDVVRSRFAHATIATNSVAFPKATDWDSAAFETRKEAVGIYQAHLSRYIEADGAIDRDSNPWFWLPTHHLDFAKQESLLRHMGTLRGACEAHVVLIEAFIRTFHDLVATPEDWLRSAKEWKTILSALPAPVAPDLLQAFLPPPVRVEIKTFLAALGEYDAAHRSLPNADLLMDSDIAAHSRQLIELLAAEGFEEFTLQQLKRISELVHAVEVHSAPAARAVEELAAALGIEAEFSMRCLNDLLASRSLIAAAPMGMLPHRHARFEKEGFIQKLRSAEAECRSVIEQRTKCQADFDLDHVDSIDSLDEAIEALEATPWYLRLFRKRFKTARTTYSAICLHPQKKSSAQQMANGLRYLAGQLRKTDAFSQKWQADEEIGPLFEGLGTRWADYISLTLWYEELAVRLPSHLPFADSLRKLLLSLPASRLKGIRDSQSGYAGPDQLGHLASTLMSLHESLPKMEFDRSSAPIRAFLESSKKIAGFCAQLLEIAHALRFNEVTNKQELVQLFDKADSLGFLRASLRDNRNAKTSLGAYFQGEHSDRSAIFEMLQFSETIMGSLLPSQLKIWLMDAEFEARSKWLEEWLSDFDDNALLIASTEEKIEAVLGKPLNFGSKAATIAAINKGLKSLCACLDAAMLLPMWVDVRYAMERLDDLGISILVDAVTNRGLLYEELLHAYEYLFYDSLVRCLFNQHPDLWRLSGTTHEETRRKFVELDKAVIELSQLKIAYQASRTPVPRGHGGKPKEKTDLALIQHEITKQRAHIPVRQLVSRAGKAIQALKPCFMMSPMSVAQFLEPGSLKFDLVVMDEASQLRPEDALGAISRGAQLVVVGDPKQLPPTSFFQRTVADEEDDEDRTVADEGESILDVAQNLYQPVRRLRWHYRSQHHSLIAFSNGEFYDNNLVVFPSAFQEHPDLGVKYIAVAGVYERRRNQIEAERVVDAVLEHIKNHPSESLGIVTMNFDQRELIEELLYAKLQNDSFASTWIEHREEGAEPFFIKNLENVQGDERDVIFISVTYGKDSKGNLFQRFAGVNSQTGHRRLNVLVTRSKKRTTVFSSIDSADINVTPATPWGVRALKGYLDYAKRGVTSQPVISPGAEPSNEHEAAIGMLLKENGFDFVPQVGVSGYFIDLAVKHPTKPGTFLLGIEFDGKSYHSGKSARDRDRLRQMTLENQGWKIHRIWSTDWFKNRDAESDRLLRRVRDLTLLS